jgi:hypothetical protein
MGKPLPPKLKRFPAAKQRRLDQLLAKNAEGALSSTEKVKLELLVEEAEALMVANSKQLADFARSQSTQPPVAAVPVTIWVNPQIAEH